jgi:hypothetical protein
MAEAGTLIYPAGGTCSEGTPTPTNTPGPSATPTDTPTVAPTDTASPTPTDAPASTSSVAPCSATPAPTRPTSPLPAMAPATPPAAASAPAASSPPAPAPPTSPPPAPPLAQAQLRPHPLPPPPPPQPQHALTRISPSPLVGEGRGEVPLSRLSPLSWLPPARLCPSPLPSSFILPPFLFDSLSLPHVQYFLAHSSSNSRPPGRITAPHRRGARESVLSWPVERWPPNAPTPDQIGGGWPPNGQIGGWPPIGAFGGWP